MPVDTEYSERMNALIKQRSHQVNRYRDQWYFWSWVLWKRFLHFPLTYAQDLASKTITNHSKSNLTRASAALVTWLSEILGKSWRTNQSSLELHPTNVISPSFNKAKWRASMHTTRCLHSSLILKYDCGHFLVAKVTRTSHKRFSLLLSHLREKAEWFIE